MSKKKPISKPTKITQTIEACDAEKFLYKMPNDSIDMLFADPPYGIGFKYEGFEELKDPDHFVAWLKTWMWAALPKIKPDGSMWIMMGDSYVADVKKIADSFGLHLRSWIVWYFTFGQRSTKKFTPSHVHILYLTKSDKAFTFNGDEVLVPSARQTLYGDNRAVVGGKVPDNTWILRPQDIPEQLDADVWTQSRLCGTHKAKANIVGNQLPEKLVARAILAATNPGDLVVDPFVGNGTTAIVCRKLGRNAKCCDLVASVAKRAAARLAKVDSKAPIS